MEHDEYDLIEDAFNEALETSLAPRGPGVLYDVIAGLSLPDRGSAIDVGCGEGEHAIELAQRFSLTVLGIDPLVRRLDTGRAAASSLPRDVAERVTFEQGTAEHLPADDSSTDLVLCRELLYVVDDLDAALRECRRVITPGGFVVVYQLFNTDWLEPAEALRFWGTHAAVARADANQFEAAAETAGLRVAAMVDLKSETVEYIDERNGKAGRELRATARLLRAPERYIERFGVDAYDTKLNDALWFVYRMLGKLTQRVYVLRSS